MKINVQKIQKNSTTARDYRKIRSNPQFFLKRLSRRNWNVLENMKKVDDMVILRTEETNDCLDECACVKFMNHQVTEFDVYESCITLTYVHNLLISKAKIRIFEPYLMQLTVITHKDHLPLLFIIYHTAQEQFIMSNKLGCIVVS